MTKLFIVACAIWSVSGLNGHQSAQIVSKNSDDQITIACHSDGVITLHYSVKDGAIKHGPNRMQWSIGKNTRQLTLLGLVEDAYTANPEVIAEIISDFQANSEVVATFSGEARMPSVFAVPKDSSPIESIVAQCAELEAK